MHREYHRWFSPALHRDMELLLFGHAGARALAYPTSSGRFFDWEDRGLVRAVSAQIESGALQLCCLDSVDSESWYAREKPPAERIARHQQYDDYVAKEVVPFTLQKNSNPFLIVTGASFGGYHAVDFGLRHPDVTSRILSMSGLCDIRRFTDGYYDATTYSHNPVDFLANESDPQRLQALRKLDIILAVGRDDNLSSSNAHLSQILWEKGIWHALRVWDGFAHDWPVWEQMLKRYIGGHD
ncbi:MAG TPA: alpha/beta hydrolase-fold protein [Gemmataceae bacterium]|jgi:esterase/lipase superfamily enzyme|nr:alpha/beta hydrolase-fold protein [Gemmataceae bacterium]